MCSPLTNGVNLPSSSSSSSFSSFLSFFSLPLCVVLSQCSLFAAAVRPVALTSGAVHLLPRGDDQSDYFFSYLKGKCHENTKILPRRFAVNFECRGSAQNHHSKIVKEALLLIISFICVLVGDLTIQLHALMIYAKTGKSPAAVKMMNRNQVRHCTREFPVWREKVS